MPWVAFCAVATATQCNILQHAATHCNTLQLMTCVYTSRHIMRLKCVLLVDFCNTLQHTATHCNTSQYMTSVCISRRIMHHVCVMGRVLSCINIMTDYLSSDVCLQTPIKDLVIDNEIYHDHYSAFRGR